MREACFFCAQCKVIFVCVAPDRLTERLYFGSAGCRGHGRLERTLGCLSWGAAGLDVPVVFSCATSGSGSSEMGGLTSFFRNRSSATNTLHCSVAGE